MKKEITISSDVLNLLSGKRLSVVEGYIYMLFHAEDGLNAEELAKRFDWTPLDVTNVMVYLDGEKKIKAAATKRKKEAFEKWWPTYPKINGRRVGKQSALTQFLKIPASQWKDLKEATENYAKEVEPGFFKHAERFLKVGFWKDFCGINDTLKSEEEYIITPAILEDVE